MRNSVVIKGNKYGIIVVLDKIKDFNELKEDITYKFKESKDFLGKSSFAISFEGRELSDDEIKEILDIIEENTDLKIVCVVDKEKEELYKKIVEDSVGAEDNEEKKNEKENINEADNNDSKSDGINFYAGTLRSGQEVVNNESIVIIGDVNPGASVISKGNILILGSLRGSAIAGIDGDTNAFVIAMEMDPIQIRIADIIATANDDTFQSAMHIREKKKNTDIKIAYAADDNIFVEPLDKAALDNIFNNNNK